MKTIIVAILAVLSVNICKAQEINKAKIDSLFQILEANDKFMGSIAISQNGQIIYSNSIGYDDLQTKKESTTNTKYRIGSISKMFTSVLVFKAVEENKLSLESTLDKFFPQIDNAAKITISDMLYHRSGIYSLTNSADYLQWNTTPKTRQEMLDIMAGSKSIFEPDSKTEYSNSNFVLLGYILEDIYQKPYKEILTEKVIQPIGLANTYVGDAVDLNKNESYSYKIMVDWVKETETNMSIPGGAGAVVSTPADLTKFIEALFSGKLISEESLAKMTTIRGDYGMGIFQMPVFEIPAFGHTGAIDAYFSIVAYFPDNNLSIAISTNGSGFDFFNIYNGALSCYFNKPYSLPVFIANNLKAEDLQAYIGDYSCKQIPIKINISAEGNKLIAQAEGQSAFALDQVEKDIFSFATAGIVIEFNPAKNTLVLKQGGGEFVFEKN